MQNAIAKQELPEFFVVMRYESKQDVEDYFGNDIIVPPSHYSVIAFSGVGNTQLEAFEHAKENLSKLFLTDGFDNQFEQYYGVRPAEFFTSDKKQSANEKAQSNDEMFVCEIHVN